MIKVRDLNQLITCRLCSGYLIDSVTIIECLHSFCKTCLVLYFNQKDKKSCPTCNLLVHKAKPLLNIRSDPILQDIVYKLVPGLFKNEMNRRNEFHQRVHPNASVNTSNTTTMSTQAATLCEEKERVIYSPDDQISLSIEYHPQVISYSFLPFHHEEQAVKDGDKSKRNLCSNTQMKRYLQCSAGMKIYHLKKWLKYKYELQSNFDVQILYKHDLLQEDYSIMDLADIFQGSWKKTGPLPLYYKIVDLSKPLKRKTHQNNSNEGTKNFRLRNSTMTPTPSTKKAASTDSVKVEKCLTKVIAKLTEAHHHVIKTGPVVNGSSTQCKT